MCNAQDNVVASWEPMGINNDKNKLFISINGEPGPHKLVIWLFPFVFNILASLSFSNVAYLTFKGLTGVYITVCNEYCNR